MVRATDALTLEDARRQRHTLLQIAATRGARNVHVFGSVARNEAQAMSDIDLLGEMEQGRSVLDLRELILDLQEFPTAG